MLQWRLCLIFCLEEIILVGSIDPEEALPFQNQPARSQKVDQLKLEVLW